MRAIILAAGRGKRLGPLGDGRPKCLVELSGKPLIERQVAALRGGGVSEIGIVRGYRADGLARDRAIARPARSAGSRPTGYDRTSAAAARAAFSDCHDRR